ncbi:sigma 54-interacting transcriptional regulator [Jeotgalibacillus soli]|uniref:HTH-type transcriptional regulatory protein TyrR n=1 Tax=Jeotgalibacillus soli TaxID=889306 RepID=A0A0C2RVL0_9BACL|nr:sigma 54-interacting transcriptional regulator [Jeotgalibacillus soli]KIL45804.1 hypothetical protein KP78_21530 [Jeotgalibacillus soli]
MYLLTNADEEIIDTYDEDIIVTNRDGNVIKVTQISGIHYGMSPSELLGQSVYVLEKRGIFSPAITPLVLKKMKKVVTIQTTPNGQKVLITGIPLFNDENEVEFVISYSYDVSELIVIQEYLKELETEMSKVKEELTLLREQHLTVDGFIMESRSSQQLMKTVQKMAPLDAPVVIQGESGVGKSTLAKVIHQNSSRKEAAFIVVNCGTIPDAVFDIAFTGETRQKAAGYFALAKGGTLVLKEIDQLSLASQATLTRLLKEYNDFRVIATSEQSLEEAVMNKSFREELFYTLHIVSLHIMPLRKRAEDLGEAITYYVQLFQKKYHVHRKLSDELYLHLLQLEWRGNFREVKNVLERSFIECDGTEITSENLPIIYRPQKEEQMDIDLEGHSLPLILEHVEKKVLHNAQKRYRTTTEMAKVLGISQPSVVRKLQKYSINENGRTSNE